MVSELNSATIAFRLIYYAIVYNVMLREMTFLAYQWCWFRVCVCLYNCVVLSVRIYMFCIEFTGRYFCVFACELCVFYR